MDYCLQLRLRRRRRARAGRPLPLRPDAGAGRPAPHRRGPPRAAVDRAGRPCPRVRRTAGYRRGTSFAVWAPARRAVHVIGDFNGWDIRHPCGLPASPACGSCSSPASGGAPATSTRSAAPTTRSAQGRPDGPGHGGAARDRLGRDPLAVRVGRRRVDGATSLDRPHTGPMSVYEVHLGSWARPQLPRPRRAPGQLRRRPRLHPRRVPACHGAPLRPVLGLPGHGLLRPHLAVRQPRRLPLPRRPAAPGGHRRDHGLGARRTSRATPGRSPSSTARRSTSTPTPAR